MGFVQAIACPATNLMASILRQLSDEKLEAIHHMIRRDAHTDLEIAQEASGLLGRDIAETDHAKEAVVSRYRRSAAFKGWLNRWVNREQDLKRQLALQQERYRLVSDIIQGDPADGFESVSKSVQARLLTLATEASDDELKAAASAKGWVSTLVRLVQEQSKMEMKRVGEQVMETMSESGLSDHERRRRMREIFGREDG